MKIAKILLILSSCSLLFACGGGDESESVSDTPSVDNTAPPVNEEPPNANDDTSNNETPTLDDNSSNDNSSNAGDNSSSDDSSNGDDNTSNDDTTNLNPDQAIDPNTPNGVYIYQNSPVSLLIDLERENFPIIGMDWGEEVFYVIDSATLNGDKILGKGFTGFRFNQATDSFIGARSDDQETEISLNDDRLSISINIENQKFGDRIYNYDFGTKVTALALENIVGTHLSADGSLIEINDSGMITITASADANNCIFEGMIEKLDFYYDITDLHASNCGGNADFNGEYLQGRLITAKDDQGQNFILTMAIKNTLQLAWVSAQVNE